VVLQACRQWPRLLALAVLVTSRLLKELARRHLNWAPPLDELHRKKTRLVLVLHLITRSFTASWPSCSTL
jgi:hypothetical protein